MNWIAGFFDSGSFMPHGMCILWRTDLIILHTVSDLFTALSYYSIPVALVYFAYRRQELDFRWMFLLFGLFILACGTTHLMGIWTLWYPDYALDGMVKAATAVASVATAVMLWRIMPEALAIPGKGELAAVNAALSTQIAERREAEEAVRSLNATLEERVRERTAALEAEIAERKEAQQRNRLLIDELNHRVKNTLATCRSLTSASIRCASDGESALQAVEGRLRALSVAHELLSRSQWRGTDLRLTIERELAPYCGSGRESVRLSGPEVTLAPRAATAIVMTVHELATNASKYGALSVPEGHVAVTWDILHGSPDGSRGDRLRLTWVEHGGPKVEVPAAAGFGVRLITGRVPHELGGTSTLEYHKTGVVCRMEVPLTSGPSREQEDHVAEEGAMVMPRATGSA